DFYDTNFGTSGILVPIHNAFRALFVFYLFWIVYAPGAQLLRLVMRAGLDDLNWLDRLALGFLAGTGVWHVGLLVLGLSWLYTITTAVLLPVPAVAWAFRDARIFFAQLAHSRQRLADHFAYLEQWQAVGLIAVVLLATIASTDLLVVKGLYPGGGHDYYT